MDRTPGHAPYGRPPAYEDEEPSPSHMQGGSTMRLLTHADDTQSYVS